MKIMHQEIIPIPVRPWTLNGISERMLVSHYENDYGGAVRALNAVRAELAALDAKAPGSRLRALKREELIAMGSVALHELYFGNLGGEGNKIPDNIRAILEEHFGSVAACRREFVGTAQSLAGGSGWVLLTWSRRERRLHNQIAFDHSQAAVDAAPVLALDMYEHAYHLDFGANATAYIDAFMRNVDWTAVTERMVAVRADHAMPSDDPSDQSLPSVSVEELAARLAKGEPVQVLDARPRHHISRTVAQQCSVADARRRIARAGASVVRAASRSPPRARRVALPTRATKDFVAAAADRWPRRRPPASRSFSPPTRTPQSICPSASF